MKQCERCESKLIYTNLDGDIECSYCGNICSDFIPDKEVIKRRGRPVKWDMKDKRVVVDARKKSNY